MLRYLIRRVFYAVPILVGVSLMTVLLFYATATPQQIARRNLSAKNPTREQIQEWLQQHGYDKPLPVQFRKHMKELFLFLNQTNSYVHSAKPWALRSHPEVCGPSPVCVCLQSL